jgi:pimeloyl-ACP methyl ester carboxylesterase
MTVESSPLTERTVDVGDLVVHVNEKGSGPEVVVLHHSTGPFWSPFFDALAAGFTVIAPDMPGYGRSTRPVTARHPSHLAVLLHQLLDAEARDPLHLIGLGMGGWVAAEMAAMNQRRLVSVTLVGAAGVKPREGFIHDPMTESWTDYARRGFRDADHFEAVFGAQPPQEVLDLWDYSREMTARITWKPWMWNLSLPALLRGVKTPTLVVWGSEDQIVPIDCGRQYAELMPNANLEVVDGAGHAVELEEPERLAQMVTDFTLTTS